jgi:hypothetical protein
MAVFSFKIGRVKFPRWLLRSGTMAANERGHGIPLNGGHWLNENAINVTRNI